jgi:methylenetetrahydrofolate dehydrogenase (NADP+)/methenyltetrahydrofolate cyclohydrolase
MSARILDGARVAADIRAAAAARIEALSRQLGRPPSLGVVLAGENAASEIYVGSKLKTGSELGLRTELVRFPETVAVGELLAAVDRLNRSRDHDGILVQAPLPAALGHTATQRVFDSIDPAKDVDGFHPVNAGLLVQNRARLVACTPAGVMQLLDRSGIEIARRRAVVIGRSDIVGKPMALLLLHRDATVTICHSKTPDLPHVAASADILVAALGRPAFVTPDFVKPGATVIDVGINRLTDRAAVERLFPAGSPRRATFERRGSVVVGDVHPDVAGVAGALTPVPGGVGPLTIAMLIENTVRCAEGRCAESRMEN